MGNVGDANLPRQTARRQCPFCDWYLDDTGPDVDLGHLPLLAHDAGGPSLSLSQQVFEASAELYRRHCATVERILEEHIVMHVEEMATA